MKLTKASLLSWLATVVVTAAAAEGPIVYSYDQQDVKPLRRTKRTPIVAEPVQSRDEKPKHYQPGSHLFPAIHPHLDKRDVQHLHTRQAQKLFYTKNGGIYLQDADMVASIDATFHWEAVILDHTAAVKNVTCKPDRMTISLDSIKSFNSAKANWTNDETIVFVSSVTTCHTEFPGQYGYFNTSSVSFDQRTLSATAKGKQISADQAVKEFNVVWGEWRAAGSPKDEDSFQAASAAAASSSRTSSRTSTTSRRSSTTTSQRTTTTSSRRSSTTTPRSSTTTPNARTTARTSSTSPRTSSRTSSSRTSSRPSSTSSRISSRTSSASSRSSSGRISTTSRTSSKTSGRISTTSRTSSITSRTSSTTFRSTGTSASTTASRGQNRLAGAADNGLSSTTSSSSIASSKPSSTSLKPESLAPLIAPTGTGLCAAVPTTLPPGIPAWFKRIPCETDFDRRLDNFFTYLRDVANVDSFIKLWAPNTGMTSADVPRPGQDLKRSRRGIIAKRSIGGFFKALVKVVVAVVKIVVAVAKAIVQAIRFVAENLLPTWNPSGSFTIPVDMAPAPAFLTKSPWGPGLSFFEQRGGKSKFGLDAPGILAEWTGADKLLTFEIDGVEQLPVPGVQMWCVDCGFGGDIRVTGSAVFTIVGPTRLILRLVGDLEATIQIGVNGFAEFAFKPFEKRLLVAGLPGFSIPGVISIGPYLTLDIDAKLQIEVEGQMLAGLQMEWPAVGMQVDFMSWTDSKAFGYWPRIKPVFNASAEITATASIGIPFGINVGVDILNGIFEKSVAVVDRPAIQAVAKYAEKHVLGEGSEVGAEECPGGIYFYSNLINELELQIFDEWRYDIGTWEGPKFLEGCVTDGGKAIVRQLQAPALPGQTRAKCPLPGDAFRNGNFANGFDGWQIKVNPDNGGARLISGNNQLRMDREGITDAGCVATLCEDIPLFPGTCRADGICDGGCDAACPQPNEFKLSISQEVDMCTYTTYELEVSGILARNWDTTFCRAIKWTVTSPNGVKTYPFEQFDIYPAGGKNNAPVPINAQPIRVSIPSKDNVGVYRVKVSLDIECMGEDFDLRLANFKMTPDVFSNSAKRDMEFSLQPRLVVDSSLATIHPAGSSIGKRQNTLPEIGKGNTLPEIGKGNTIPEIGKGNALPEIGEGNTLPEIGEGNTLPEIGEGNTLPEIDPANEAPAVGPTLAAPELPGATTAPDLNPNNEAPALDWVAQPNKVSGTIGAAVPTATAVLLGRPNYQFPTFDEIMEKATQGVIGSAPGMGSGLPYTGWHMLPDLQAKSRLAAAEDGNFYMVSNRGGASPATNFFSEDSIAFKDESERMFYFFPDTMKAYGVSRIRAALPLDTPLTAQVITLIPVNIPDSGRVAYIAADLNGNNYLLAWCTAPKWPGSKVFLVSDYDKGLPTLLSGHVQWIVTGNNVTECDPLVLTSNAGGLPVPGE